MEPQWLKQEIGTCLEDAGVLEFELKLGFFQGQPASWRDFHTATAIGRYMYIFGGRGKFSSNKTSVDRDTTTWKI
jgi:hypothetical protein